MKKLALGILCLGLLCAGLLVALWWWWTPPGPPIHRTVKTTIVQVPPPPVVAPPVVSNSSPSTSLAPTQRLTAVLTAENLTLVPITNRPNVPRPAAPPPAPESYPRPPRDLFEAQVVLARRGISPGSIDGLPGNQTRAALRALQKQEHLPETGELDDRTAQALVLASPPLGSWTVQSNDLARLQPLSPTWLGKSQQASLGYESLLEMAAETSRAQPRLLRQLNPTVDWTNAVAGTALRLPVVTGPDTEIKAAFLVISLHDKTLEAFDAQTNLLAHFPCSIAARVEKRPAGELHVASIAPNPNYTFDPALFPESAEARQLKTRLVLPPGPNNPVGVAWIGLDKPGYGIHGTPSPEQVGRTESHGCFRLANWNAEHLLKLVVIGTPVLVEQSGLAPAAAGPLGRHDSD